MNFDDLKEQLSEKIEELKDSELWQTASEKFQGLSQPIQKLIVWASVVCGTLFLFTCMGPVGYLNESSNEIAIFEDKREQIQRLLVAKQRENQTNNIPQQMSSSQFRNSIQSVLSAERLLPEQNSGVSTFDASKSALNPKNSKNIQKEGFQIALKKLNLNQVVNIGFKLENINPAVKMAGLEIQANTEDDHYFDVIYKITKFSLNLAPPKKTPPAKNKKPRKKRGS